MYYCEPWRTTAPRTTPPRRTTPNIAVLFALGLSACGRPAPEPDRDVRQSQTAIEGQALLGPRASLVSSAPAVEEGWNVAAIDWQPYEAGLARARAQNKPVCLVLYADWCPHCRNYSRVFNDGSVLAQAKDFVMIRVNSDKNPEVNQKYAPDGSYVPRTYFLAPDGKLAEEIHAKRPKFLYFYDEFNPAALVAGMNEALGKLAKP